MFDGSAGNEFLLSIIAFGLVLIPAILVHEFGHFLAGKSVGITILEFGIGFPPRLTRLFRWGETEFTLNWLPIGGFVIPLGEDFVKPVGEEQVQQDREKLEQRMAQPAKPQDEDLAGWERARRQGVLQPKAVHQAKPLERIWFMSAGALANFVSAFVLFAVVAMLGVQQFAGATLVIASVHPNSPLAQAGVQDNDVIVALNDGNFTSTSDFFARLNTATAPVTLTLRRGAAGEIVTVTVTPDAAAAANADVRAGYVRIMGVVDGSPAADAGIRPGDLIVSLNDEAMTDSDLLRVRVGENAGREIALVLLRDWETVTTTLTPRLNPPDGQGPVGIVIQSAFGDALSGVVYQEGQAQTVIVSQNPLQALGYAATNTAEAMAMVARLPFDILTGRISGEAARPVSIVGISSIGGQFLQESIEQNTPALILNFIALINIALGVTNLLPLPALDGGRILFVLIEMLRGRPMKPELEGYIHMLGMMLLLGVAVIFILNDIFNPISLAIPR